MAFEAFDLRYLADLLGGIPALVMGVTLVLLSAGRRPLILGGIFLFATGLHDTCDWLSMSIGPTTWDRGSALYLAVNAFGLVPIALGILFVAACPTPSRAYTRSPWLFWIPLGLAGAYMLAFLSNAFVYFDVSQGHLVWTQNVRWIYAAGEWGKVAILIILLARLARERPGRPRAALALVGTALLGTRLIYIADGYAAFLWAPLAGVAPPWWRLHWGPTIPSALQDATDQVWVILAIVALVVAFRLREKGPEERFLAGALLVALLLGTLQSFLNYFAGAGPTWWAVWSGVGAIVCAAALLQVAPLEPARQRTILVAGGILALALVYFAVAGGVLALAGGIGDVAAGTIGMLALAIAIVPMFRFGARLTEGSAAVTPVRRLDAYRAALEDVIAQTPTTGTPSSAKLARLRAKLGVSESEHEVLLHVIRETTERSAAQRLAPGNVLAGRYIVEASLGEAWLAKDARLGRRVRITPAKPREIDAARQRFGTALHDVVEVGREAYVISEHTDP